MNELSQEEANDLFGRSVLRNFVGVGAVSHGCRSKVDVNKLLSLSEQGSCKRGYLLSL